MSLEKELISEIKRLTLELDKSNKDLEVKESQFTLDSVSHEKVPIYTIGSADPRAFARGNPKQAHCYPPSGIDMKVTFTEEGGKKENLSTVQGISFQYGESAGSLMVVLFGDEKPAHRLLNKKGQLEAICSSEYGLIWTYFSEKVSFDSFGSGCSIDDIIIDGTYTFSIL